jgi:hypothetical protein
VSEEIAEGLGLFGEALTEVKRDYLTYGAMDFR